MYLAVVQYVNGVTTVKSEWKDNEKGAMVDFHNTCKILWNADDVKEANVKILDEGLNCYGGKTEFISHPDPEPEPEAAPQVVQGEEESANIGA